MNVRCLNIGLKGSLLACFGPAFLILVELPLLLVIGPCHKKSSSSEARPSSSSCPLMPTAHILDVSKLDLLIRMPHVPKKRSTLLLDP